MSERLGKYRLLKRLAAGGMAEIWLAKQHGVEGFEKLVVIKRILPNLADNDEFVQMFLDEARLAAQLSHPNIVQIFELGRSEGSYFIAMEFIHGENLRSVMKAAARAGQPMPVNYVAKVVSMACEALYYAHTKADFSGRPLGIVHRDVSPQNLLLSFEGQVKVVDFGIAKAATQVQETRTGVLKGKYAYMSPEQCRGQKLDARSDIFALGIVLWELATGTRLYKHKSELMILKAITEEPTPAPTEVRRAIPAELEAIILKALAKRREDRFQTCHEMHMALEGFLHGQGQPLSPVHLAQYVSGLFPDKLAGWQRIVAAQDEGDGLESELFDDLGDLFDGGTPSSRVSTPSQVSRRTGGAGARPLVAVTGDTGTQATVSARPGTGADLAGARTGVRPAGPGHTRSRWPVAVLSVLLVAVGGGWLYQSVLAPRLNRAPPVDTRTADAGPPGKAGGVASLLIDTEPPDARVVVDGVARASTTPARIPDLAVGAHHRIRVEAAGYRPWQTEIVLDHAGDERHLSAHLEKARPNLPAPHLSVSTEPEGATVFVDGIKLPQPTPLDLDVDVGHAGSLVRIEKDGYQTEAHTVDLEPGTRPSLLVSLRPTKASPAEHPPAHVAHHDRRRPPHHRHHPAGPSAASGTLAVNARPWCNIRIDGKLVGQTPLVGYSLPAGHHQLVCHNPDFGVSKTRSIDIEPHANDRETIVFGFGKLVVNVKPWVRVTVNGKVLGTTPMAPPSLPEGSYRVVLDNKNFSFHKTYQVRIVAGKAHTISGNLLK